MVCPPVQTGRQFLQDALAHIDCQAQSIGSLGFGALSTPGSSISIALTGILVLFVAVFGIRLATGRFGGGRDLSGDAIRLLVVLVLATSWSAWRVIGYDVLIHGPAEISRAIGAAADLPGSGGDLPSRLQRVDNGLAMLNELGSGRRGVANGDWFQLGFARSAFLTGTLGSLALVRLVAGILLAIAPLVAGLLLFRFSRSIFSGWAKGLVAAFLATVGVTIVLSVQLALLEPWLERVLRLRDINEQALSAPTEALILTLTFALASFGAIAIAARIAFHPSLVVNLFPRNDVASNRSRTEIRTDPVVHKTMFKEGDRARNLAWTVANSVHRDARLERGIQNIIQPVSAPAPVAADGHTSRTCWAPAHAALGSSHRRNSRRTIGSSMQRDKAGGAT